MSLWSQTRFGCRDRACCEAAVNIHGCIFLALPIWHLESPLGVDGGINVKIARSGNIGMGYSAMTVDPGDANPVRVSSYYTGRYASDPLGTMTIEEQLIANGNANIPGLRYGDYSKIDIDPVNDKTFWFINEYMNSGRKNVVGVSDRTYTFGYGGPFFSEVGGAIYNGLEDSERPILKSYMLGVGGRDVRKKHIKDIFNNMLKIKDQGKLDQEIYWYGLKDAEKPESEGGF